MSFNVRTVFLNVSFYFQWNSFSPVTSCWSLTRDPYRPTLSLPRLVLSCLRLVHGHRQLKQVWDAGDTTYTPGGVEGVDSTRRKNGKSSTSSGGVIVVFFFKIALQVYSKNNELIITSCQMLLVQLANSVFSTFGATKYDFKLAVKQSKLLTTLSIQPLSHWSVLLFSSAVCLLCACLTSVRWHNGTNTEFDDELLLAGSLSAQPTARAGVLRHGDPHTGAVLHLMCS